jgi:hypothetical protein
MHMNWASIALTPPPLPTLKQRWDALVATYAVKPQRLVLLEVLGLLEAPLSSAAAPLVEHCIVVAVDTEAWTANTDEMTEIGLVVAEYNAGKELNGDTGAYGENVLKKMRYYHLIICENAHLKTSASWMRGAAGNRFGASRFVTFAEARSILDFILNQPIVSSNLDLAGLKRPVVLLGHAVSHDTHNIARGGLSYNFRKHGTVVGEIDTQKMVRQAGCWVDRKGRGNDIGLDTLCEGVFGIRHEDAHTALNDAARTMICAVNLALRSWKKKEEERFMQEVALEIERHSRETFSSSWGSGFCCTRCGARDHDNSEGGCKAAVYCNACDRFDETTMEVSESAKQLHISSHIEQFCLHVAESNAWKRRVFDADRKNNPLPPGPPPGSHPRSDWRGKWPMTDPSDDLKPEMSEIERITKPLPKLGLKLPAASAPSVKVVTLQSDARVRAQQARRERGMSLSRRSTTSTTGDSQASSQGKLGVDDAWNGTAW